MSCQNLRLPGMSLALLRPGLGRPEAKMSFEQAIKLHPNWQQAEEMHCANSKTGGSFRNFLEGKLWRLAVRFSAY